MTSEPLLSLGTFAAFGAVTVALVIVARSPRLAQNWWLLFGVCISAAAVISDSFTSAATDLQDIGRHYSTALLIRSFLPGAWLAFSLTFARAPGRPYHRRSIIAIVIAFLAPIALGLVYREHLVIDVRLDETGIAWVLLDSTARLLHVMMLAGIVVALMKVEGTFRSTIGTTRWRMKFVMLGIAVMLGTLIYSRAQSVLFSQQPTHRSVVDALGLLLAAGFLTMAIRRGAFEPHDVVSPKLSIGHSVTVFVVGGYLFVVGILAQVIVLLGKTASFQVQATIVLLGIATAAVILLSDRARQNLQQTFSRAFGRPVYDFRKVWTQFSRQLSTEHQPDGVCSTAARLISDTFHVLSTRIWLRLPGATHLRLGASTAPSGDESLAGESECALPPDLAIPATPFNLEKADGPLAEILRRCSPSHFRQGGDRMAIPLLDHDRPVGIAVLADRVNGAPYSPEELDLLECIATQISATLINLRITRELVQAKELEAFQTMSAFFVHDLKNAVSTLNLMLQNLPVHFANPEFRQDALRGIAKTADRVNHLIARLSALRGKVELRRSPTDLVKILQRAREENGSLGTASVTEDFCQQAPILGDAEHLSSVVSNLLLNARDAVSDKADGEILLRVALDAGKVFLTVRDNGVGMTHDFIQNSLFRPFSSTKAKGLGIGMFQCKAIVEAHQGTIDVESSPGKGTQIQIRLPELPASGPTDR